MLNMAPWIGREGAWTGPLPSSSRRTVPVNGLQLPGEAGDLQLGFIVFIVV